MLGDYEDIRKIYGVLERFTSFRRPGTYLVETFPFLANWKLFNYFSDWQAVGREIQRKDEEVYSSFWNGLKKQLQDGTAPHSWGKAFLLSDYESHGIDELGAIYAAYAVLMQRYS